MIALGRAPENISMEGFRQDGQGGDDAILIP